MSFDFWENFVLSSVLGIITSLRKSPSDIPKFQTVLIHIITDGCALLGVPAPDFSHLPQSTTPPTPKP